MTTVDPDGPTGPPSSRAEEGLPGTRAAQRLIADLRNEIARADDKASILMGALGITVGLWSGLLTGRGWSPDNLSPTGTALWWCGATALLCSLLSLLLAVLPRLGGSTWSPGAPLSFFGDIRQAVRAGLLESSLINTERHPVAALTAALSENSRIAVRKHQWIRAGLIAFSLGTVLLPTALLIG